jgi:hypothetical protein
VGTLIEGPTEWFSARVERRERTRTFVEEVLAGEEGSKVKEGRGAGSAKKGRFGRKYEELQGRKRSGKKAYYKAVKQKRKGFGKV